MGWTSSAAFPLCRAAVQVLLLPQTSSSTKYAGVLDFETDIGLHLASEAKIIGHGQAEKVSVL